MTTTPITEERLATRHKRRKEAGSQMDLEDFLAKLPRKKAQATKRKKRTH